MLALLATLVFWSRLQAAGLFACQPFSCIVSSTSIAAAPKTEPLPVANHHHDSEGRRSSKSALKNSLTQLLKPVKARECWSCLLLWFAGLTCRSRWVVCLLVFFLHCVLYRCSSENQTAPSGKSPWQWRTEKLQKCAKYIPSVNSETRQKQENACLAACARLLVSLGGLLAGLLPALCPVPLQLRKLNHSQRQITMAVKLLLLLLLVLVLVVVVVVCLFVCCFVVLLLLLLLLLLSLWLWLWLWLLLLSLSLLSLSLLLLFCWLLFVVVVVVVVFFFCFVVFFVLLFVCLFV